MFTLNSVHDSEAKNRADQTLKNAPKFNQLLSVFATEIQTLENVLYSLFSQRLLSTAVGMQLDVLGAIVGQIRGNSVDDLEYRRRISARVLVNRSSGDRPKLLKIIETIKGTLADVVFLHDANASFIVGIFGTVDVFPDQALYIELLHDAKAAGINGNLLMSEFDVDRTFAFATSTRLTQNFLIGDSILNVVSTVQFPSSGSIKIGFENYTLDETLTYTSKTETTFQGVSLSVSNFFINDLVAKPSFSPKSFANVIYTPIRGHLATVAEV